MDNELQHQSNAFSNLPDSFYKSLLQCLHDGVYMVDMERRIMFWNQSAEAMTGYTAEEVMGRFCGDGLLQHVDMNGNPLCGNGCPLLATIEDGNPRQADVFFKHKNGHRVPVRVTADCVHDGNGKLIGAVETFIDITPHLQDRKKIKELSEKANRDTLTGLYNRTALDMFLQDAFSHWESYQESFGVLFIDMDDLKQINDQLGHFMGDMAILAVANTLKSCFRDDDIIARWGGDEFLIILRNVNQPLLEQLEQKADAIIRQTQLPGCHDWDMLSASVGGAIIQPGDTLKTLVGRADTLMYERKKSRK